MRPILIRLYVSSISASQNNFGLRTPSARPRTLCRPDLRRLVFNQNIPVHPISESRGGGLSVTDKGQRPTKILVSNIGFYIMKYFWNTLKLQVFHLYSSIFPLCSGNITDPPQPEIFTDNYYQDMWSNEGQFLVPKQEFWDPTGRITLSRS